MTQYCFINNQLYPIEKASISAQDRGFRFGDGVFETIAMYHGIPYQWELHMQRLKSGLKALDIPFNTERVRQQALQLASKNGLSDATLRITISRGVGSQGYLPTGAAQATVVVEAMRRHTPPADPASLWLSSYEKPSARALPVQYKTAQGLNSTLVRMEAAKHGCLDGLQCNAQGEICETSSANLFWRVGDTLFTPALECGLLAGTTREALLRLSPYRVEMGAYTLEHLREADACIATNSHWQAMPVTRLEPAGWDFPASVALALELRAVIQKDIHAYTQTHRA